MLKTAFVLTALAIQVMRSESNAHATFFYSGNIESNATWVPETCIMLRLLPCSAFSLVSTASLGGVH